VFSLRERAKCASPTKIAQLLHKKSKKNPPYKHILISSGDDDKRPSWKILTNLWLFPYSLLHFCNDNSFQSQFVPFVPVKLSRDDLFEDATLLKETLLLPRVQWSIFRSRHSLKLYICMATTLRFSWRLRRFSGPDLKVGLKVRQLEITRERSLSAPPYPRDLVI